MQEGGKNTILKGKNIPLPDEKRKKSGAGLRTSI
jgi:hypothetical protein